MMQIIKSTKELSQALLGHNDIAFVPTMGALHQGHIALVSQARQIAKTVVVSVFVNPTQFNDPKDFAKYPRTIEADAELLGQAGVDVVFAPSVDEVYPDGQVSQVSMGGYEQLAAVMEGALRQGHFQGVVQVVSHLFDLVQPQKALFGEKDFQQLAIIRAMVAAQGRSIEIIGCPIVRADDGLALSSRNTLLSAEQRAAAPLIYSELVRLRKAIENKDGAIEKSITRSIENLKNNKYLCPEYIEVVDPLTLLETADCLNFRVCAAVRCGSVRLIDNV